MDSKVIIQLLILVVLVIGSAFFSATETALMTLSKIRLRHMADSGNKRAKLVESLKQEPNKLLGSILLGNNAVNIAASAVATALAIEMMGSSGVGVVTVVMTVVILIFGEITPKSLAMEYSEKLSLLVAPIINIIVKVATPFVWILTKITNVIIRLFGGNPDDQKPFITEEELKTIVNVSSEEGLLENDEKKMIYNIFEYGDLRVKDIMIQRMDVLAISIDASYSEIVEVFEEKKFSRLPVYEDTIDNIVGILYAKDILFSTSFKSDEFSIESLMRSPFQTFEFIKISDFF
ncbi:MAG: CNNM domain-containing protein, partial [Filifactoraceae bacterium]